MPRGRPTELQERRSPDHEDSAMATTVFYVPGNPGSFSAFPADKDLASRCRLSYLNEGGANVVFQITETEEEPLPDDLEGKILRLRKDLSHVQRTVEQHASFVQHFSQLFPADNLIEHELVSLEPRVIELLNTALASLVRPSHRLQDFLPTEESQGLLVTDMTAETGDVVAEIKPKWLLQSPTAPAKAKRCRTCALRAQRTSQRTRTATDAQEGCPLDLISQDVGNRMIYATSVTNDQKLRTYLAHHATPLLSTLRRHQMHLDPKGTLKASSAEELYDLCKAMTIRDCTLFLKRSGEMIEARLGDLDLKKPEKIPRWRKVEQSLIDEGWYANAEGSSVWSPEKQCALSRMV